MKWDLEKTALKNQESRKIGEIYLRTAWFQNAGKMCIGGLATHDQQ